MQDIIEYISYKKEAFAQHAFFKHLSDDNLSLTHKLNFMPYMAYFIMSFGDINKHVLPFQAPKDNYELAINVHAKEDEQHWIWYLEDLRTLDFNKNDSFTDVLETLWSDDFSASRQLTYKLVALIQGQPAIRRYVVIEVMEATGNVTFTQLEKMTSGSEIKLNFLGELHLSRESGHLMLDEANIFESVELSELESVEFKKIVDECFDAFHGFMDQLSLKLI